MINYVEGWEGGLLFYSATVDASYPAYVVAQGVEILNRETFTSHMAWHENISEGSEHERMLLEIISKTKPEAAVE